MLKPKSATSCRDLPFFEVLHEANLDPARDTGTYFTAKEEACIPSIGDCRVEEG